MFSYSTLSRVRPIHHILLAMGATLLVVSACSLAFRGEVTWDFIVTGILASLLASSVSTKVHLLFQGEIERRNTLLDAERLRSEQLLLNILPTRIADRLQHGEHVIADHFPEATVLFADLVGFTELASRVDEVRLVEILNRVFSHFDTLAEQLGLEKIKTIGDAYLVVGGIPTPLPDHAFRVALMGLEMQRSMPRLSAEIGEPLVLRIGIHSGPVIAGVIGQRKFAYDLWGDTVNIASRMESHGVEGGIQVSDAFRRLIQARFQLTTRGEIPVKGKGMMRTWLLLKVLEGERQTGAREEATGRVERGSAPPGG